MISQAECQTFSADIESYLKTWKPQPLERSQPLPSQMYLSAKVYRLEQERFFGRTWLYAGHISHLDSPGSYFTTTIAEQPLLIVRDLAGCLRGFFNVCPHRAGPVALGDGKCNRLICAYHAWTFDLKGELKAAPYMESVQDFDLADYALRTIRVDTWGPFIFVNFDRDCAPLKAQLGNLPEILQCYDFSNLVRVHSIDYYIDVNWKLYFENSAESYHVHMVHPSLELFRNVDDIEIEVQPHYYLEYFPFLPKSNDVLSGFKPGLAIEGLNQREMQGASVLLMWPNFVLVLSPNFVIARAVDPQGLSRTRTHFDWLVPNTTEAKSSENVTSLVELYNTVVNEDILMLLNIQKGIQSLGYTPGHLSPILEVGIHQFQESLMTCLR